MGARKLREYNSYVEFRKIRGGGQRKKSKLPILILMILLLSGLVVFENKPEQDSKEEINEFVKESLKGKSNKQKKVSLGRISERQVKEILELTGIDVTEFQLVIENFFIYHALSKHGNDAKEQKRGQLGVDEPDFGKIPEIINKPDNILLLKSKGTNTVLQFEKQIDALYFYVIEIRKGKMELVGKTMFKRKIKGY